MGFNSGFKGLTISAFTNNVSNTEVVTAVQVEL